MKKFSVSAILSATLSALLIMCQGCSKNPPEDIKKPSPIENNYAIDVVTGETLMLVESRKSDYTILIPENAHNVEKKAAEELKNFVYEATAANIRIAKDSEMSVTANSKVILLGDTSYSTKVVAEYAQLGDSGFIMDISGNNIILKGATPEGSLYSVYEFLSQELNFEAYAIDEYYIDKVADVKVTKFDNTPQVAAIDYRQPGWGISSDDRAERMRLIKPNAIGESVYGKDWGVAAHSIAWYVYPDVCQGEQYEDWFGNGHICMTVGDKKNPDGTLKYEEDPLIDFLVNGTPENPNCLINTIIGNQTARFWELGHPDDGNSCHCETCEEGREKWGGISGIYMRWINKVGQKIESEFEKRGIQREITLMGLMYNAYQDAPATISADGTITLNGTASEEEKNAQILSKRTGNVKTTVRYAPISACYAHSFDDPQCEINSRGNYKDTLKKWKYICGDNKLFFYGYNAEFYDYVFFFNDMAYMNKQYKLLSDVGVYSVYENTISGNRNGPFMAMKVYLKSKLMWNPDLDVRNLVENFYDNYFKAASPYMKELYDGVRLHFAELSVTLNSNGCYGFNKIGAYYMEPANWPVNLLFQFQKSVDKAMNALKNAGYDQETYEKIYWRIKADEVFMTHWYVNNYSNAFSSEEFDALQKDFKATCDHLGIVGFSH